jgi:hypothetical protein
MKHSFVVNKLNPKLCGFCNRDFMSHTKKAQCNDCKKITDCELFGTSPSAKLLCPSCTEIAIHNNTVILEGTKIKRELNALEFALNGTVEQAKEIDNATRLSGDIFNAHTIPYVVIRDSIEQDETIPQDEKAFRVHEAIMARIESFKPLIRKLDDEKHQLVIQQMAGINLLRDYGNGLRKEIRERLREADNNYIVPVAEVKPRIKKETKGTVDRLVESLALAKGISIEDAAELLRKGKLI